ncbi:hypothetical protein HK103_001431 [Boothiomyces macroporosus]|uniref:Uncharacterized protein n=1 Tax=Boothiomyces macroporosus TaxID=261099 RepID=A0AAD5UAK6_9FUNG|nr:hypothetical protein HK103_001431 [Boothiomyces macroporosus]
MSGWSLNNAFEFVKSAVDSVESQLDSILDQEKKPKPTSDVFKKSKHLSKAKQNGSDESNSQATVKKSDDGILGKSTELVGNKAAGGAVSVSDKAISKQPEVDEEQPDTSVDINTVKQPVEGISIDSTIINQTNVPVEMKDGSLGQQLNKDESMKEGWGSMDDFEIEDVLDDNTMEVTGVAATEEVIGVAATEQVGDATREQVGDATREQVGDATREQVGDATREQVDAATEQVGVAATEQVGDATREQVGDATREQDMADIPDKKELYTNGEKVLDKKEYIETKVNQEIIDKVELESKSIENLKAVVEQEILADSQNEQKPVIEQKVGSLDELEKRNMQLLEAKTENAELYNRIQQLEQELAQKQSNYEMLNERYVKYKEKQDNETDSSFTEMQNALNQKEEKIAGLLKEGEDLAKQVLKANTLTKNYRKQVEDLKKENADKSTKLEQSQQKIEQLNNKMAGMKESERVIQGT